VELQATTDTALSESMSFRASSHLELRAAQSEITHLQTQLSAAHDVLQQAQHNNDAAAQEDRTHLSAQLDAVQSMLEHVQHERDAAVMENKSAQQQLETQRDAARVNLKTHKEASNMRLFVLQNEHQALALEKELLQRANSEQTEETTNTVGRLQQLQQQFDELQEKARLLTGTCDHERSQKESAEAMVAAREEAGRESDAKARGAREQADACIAEKETQLQQLQEAEAQLATALLHQHTTRSTADQTCAELDAALARTAALLTERDVARADYT